MKKKLVFTNRTAEIILVFLIILSMIENIAGLFNSLEPVKLFQVVFLTVTLILYFLENPKFIVLIKAWAGIIIFFSLLGIILWMGRSDGELNFRFWASVLGLTLGFGMLYIASEYIKLEHQQMTSGHDDIG